MVAFPRLAPYSLTMKTKFARLAILSAVSVLSLSVVAPAIAADYPIDNFDHTSQVDSAFIVGVPNVPVVTFRPLIQKGTSTTFVNLGDPISFSFKNLRAGAVALCSVRTSATNIIPIKVHPIVNKLGILKTPILAFKYPGTARITCVLPGPITVSVRTSES